MRGSPMRSLPSPLYLSLLPDSSRVPLAKERGGGRPSNSLARLPPLPQHNKHAALPPLVLTCRILALETKEEACWRLPP
uniref:Uncharacterized protein n=1 Tax=Oryza barthii TaxID=65489 RepID=A0A0D3H0X5_9ORYZ